jgi:hypothetical protein
MRTLPHLKFIPTNTENEREWQIQTGCRKPVQSTLTEIACDVNVTIENFRTEPKNEQTLAAIAGHIYALLTSYQCRGLIQHFVVKCDAENNPVSNAEIVVDWDIQVTYAAWYNLRSALSPIQHTYTFYR